MVIFYGSEFLAPQLSSEFWSTWKRSRTVVESGKKKMLTKARARDERQVNFEKHGTLFSVCDVTSELGSGEEY